jgi:hypothetical protein
MDFGVWTLVLPAVIDNEAKHFGSKYQKCTYAFDFSIKNLQIPAISYQQ